MPSSAMNPRGKTTARTTALVRRISTETKHSLKTTEFAAYVVAVIGVLVASAIAGESSDFGTQEEWLYVILLTIGYMVSRGLAKAGSRDFYDDNNNRGQHPDGLQVGQRRDWDGSHGTDHPVLLASGTSDPSSARAQGPQPGAGTQSSSGRPAWHIPLAAGVAGGILGLIIGAAAGGTSDPTASEEYQALAADLDETESRLDATEAELEDTESALGDLSKREDQLAKRKKDLDERARKLDAAAQAGEKREGRRRDQPGDRR